MNNGILVKIYGKSFKTICSVAVYSSFNPEFSLNGIVYVKNINLDKLQTHIFTGVRKNTPRKKAPRKKAPEKIAPRKISLWKYTPKENCPRKIVPRKNCFTRFLLQSTLSFCCSFLSFL